MWSKLGDDVILDVLLKLVVLTRTSEVPFVTNLWPVVVGSNSTHVTSTIPVRRHRTTIIGPPQMDGS